MRRLALLLPLILVAGCEPSELEAGQTVIFIALPITLIAMAFLLGLTRAWQRLDPSIQLSFRPSWKLVGFIIVLWLAVFVTGVEHGTEEWLGFGLWFVGTSYLSVFLIALRIGFTRKLRSVLPFTVAIPWVVFLTPAIVCAAMGRPDVPVPEWMQALWIFPGFGGYITGGLLLVLVLELVIRLAIRARQPGPQLPSARISDRRSGSGG